MNFELYTIAGGHGEVTKVPLVQRPLQSEALQLILYRTRCLVGGNDESSKVGVAYTLTRVSIITPLISSSSSPSSFNASTLVSNSNAPPSFSSIWGLYSDR